MEFLLFLNSGEEKIVEIIKNIDYSLEENTPLCLIDKKFFGFMKKKSKTIVICTENAKLYGGFNLPRINKKDYFDKTGFYIRRALRHESVHVAQLCNNSEPLNLKNNKKIKMHPFKTEALKASTKISGSERKEYEAYALEDNTKQIIYILNKYCLKK
tara:strand:- start:141 stop:611 length:471 start_codon:yes stop_codon:yes gene_type:complete